MARIVKTAKDRNVRIRMHDDNDGTSSWTDGEAVLVPGGPRRAYVWVGPRDGSGNVYTFSGAIALRRFAQAILREVATSARKKSRRKA